MKFTNLDLMHRVRRELILNDALYQQKGVVYTDPMFGSFFRTLIDLTVEIVPRFSCEGHFEYMVLDEKEEDWKKAELVDGKPVDENAFAHFISDPYISFLCTEKGFELIRTWFRRLVKRAIAEGMNPTIFQLTESVYYGEEESGAPDEDDQTGRITLRILPYFDANFFDYHAKAVELMKTTLVDTLLVAHHTQRN